MSHNGGMQPYYGPVTDNTCLTDGGTSTIVTGNEWPYVNKISERMGYTVAPLGMEDDSHVQGVYRKADFAGS